MICPRCQASMADNVSFCTNCGTQFGTAGQRPQGSSGEARQAQPGYQQQGQPAYSQPAYNQPGYAPQGQPTYSQPTYNQPGYSQPGYAPQGQSRYNQPAPPGYSPQGRQPGYNQPGQQPGYRPPAGPPHHGPQFAFDLKRLSPVDQVIGGASLILIITLFLPWFGAGTDGFSVSVSGLDAHGFLFIALLTAIILIAYLILRAGWDDPPVKLPIAHAPLRLVGTGIQFLLVLLAFLLKPPGGGVWGWQFGAWLGLLAALVACGAIVVPAIQSMQGGGTSAR
jgi:hypothetical protein